MRILKNVIRYLGASLLGILRTSSRNKKGKGIVRTGTGKQWDF